jgi:hypothetical protein
MREIDIIPKTRKQITTLHLNNKSANYEINCLSYYCKFFRNNPELVNIKTNLKEISSNSIINIEKKYNKENINFNLIFETSNINENPSISDMKTKLYNLITGLYLLPIKGSIIIKLSLPININYLFNLIYLCYRNFEEMMVYKPILILDTKDFFLICKKNKGIDTNLLSDYMKLLDSFDKNTMDTDFYTDEYPEAFVSQFFSIYNKLVNNYTFFKDKQMFYYNNFNLLDKRFIGIAKEYVKEKQFEWLERYKLKK